MQSVSCCRQLFLVAQNHSWFGLAMNPLTALASESRGGERPGIGKGGEQSVAEVLLEVMSFI